MELSHPHRCAIAGAVAQALSLLPPASPLRGAWARAFFHAVASQALGLDPNVELGLAALIETPYEPSGVAAASGTPPTLQNAAPRAEGAHAAVPPTPCFQRLHTLRLLRQTGRHSSRLEPLRSADGRRGPSGQLLGTSSCGSCGAPGDGLFASAFETSLGPTPVSRFLVLAALVDTLVSRGLYDARARVALHLCADTTFGVGYVGDDARCGCGAGSTEEAAAAAEEEDSSSSEEEGSGDDTDGSSNSSRHRRRRRGGTAAGSSTVALLGTINPRELLAGLFPPGATTPIVPPGTPRCRLLGFVEDAALARHLLHRLSSAAQVAAAAAATAGSGASSAAAAAAAADAGAAAGAPDSGGQITVTERLRARRQSRMRWVKIGAATLVGTGLMVLTGGLAGPAILAGIGVLGTAVGIGAVTGAAVTFFASTAGAALLLSVFGATGAGLASYKMARRTSGLKAFAFQRLTAAGRPPVPVLLPPLPPPPPAAPAAEGGSSSSSGGGAGAPLQPPAQQQQPGGGSAKGSGPAWNPFKKTFWGKKGGASGPPKQEQQQQVAPALPPSLLASSSASGEGGSGAPPAQPRRASKVSAATSASDSDGGVSDGFSDSGNDGSESDEGNAKPTGAGGGAGGPSGPAAAAPAKPPPSPPTPSASAAITAASQARLHVTIVVSGIILDPEKGAAVATDFTEPWGGLEQGGGGAARLKRAKERAALKTALGAAAVRVATGGDGGVKAEGEAASPPTPPLPLAAPAVSPSVSEPDHSALSALVSGAAVSFTVPVTSEGGGSGGAVKDSSDDALPSLAAPSSPQPVPPLPQRFYYPALRGRRIVLRPAHAPGDRAAVLGWCTTGEGAMLWHERLAGDAASLPVAAQGAGHVGAGDSSGLMTASTAIGNGVVELTTTVLTTLARVLPATPGSLWAGRGGASSGGRSPKAKLLSSQPAVALSPSPAPVPSSSRSRAATTLSSAPTASAPEPTWFADNWPPSWFESSGPPRDGHVYVIEAPVLQPPSTKSSSTQPQALYRPVGFIAYSPVEDAEEEEELDSDEEGEGGGSDEDARLVRPARASAGRRRRHRRRVVASDDDAEEEGGDNLASTTPRRRRVRVVRHRRVELRLVIARSAWWGRGIGRDALLTVMAHLATLPEVAATKFLFIPPVTRPRAIDVAKSVGFCIEGIIDLLGVRHLQMSAHVSSLVEVMGRDAEACSGSSSGGGSGGGVPLGFSDPERGTPAAGADRDPFVQLLEGEGGWAGAGEDAADTPRPALVVVTEEGGGSAGSGEGSGATTSAAGGAADSAPSTSPPASSPPPSPAPLPLPSLDALGAVVRAAKTFARVTGRVVTGRPTVFSSSSSSASSSSDEGEGPGKGVGGGHASDTCSTCRSSSSSTLTALSVDLEDTEDEEAPPQPGDAAPSRRKGTVTTAEPLEVLDAAAEGAPKSAAPVPSNAVAAAIAPVTAVAAAAGAVLATSVSTAAATVTSAATSVLRREDSAAVRRRRTALALGDTSSAVYIAARDRGWLAAGMLPLHGEAFTLVWEPAVLRKLGAMVTRFVRDFLANQAVTHLLTQTVLATLLAAVTVPQYALQALDMLDSPWTMCIDRANKAGVALAEALAEGAHGRRPVTLVGWGMGARVIFRALEELARRQAAAEGEAAKAAAAQAKKDAKRLRGQGEAAVPAAGSSGSSGGGDSTRSSSGSAASARQPAAVPVDASGSSSAPEDWLRRPLPLDAVVQDVVLLGAPVSAGPDRWRAVRKVVAGRLVSAYSSADMVLKVVYRSQQLVWHVAGVGPVGVLPKEAVDAATAAAAAAAGGQSGGSKRGGAAAKADGGSGEADAAAAPTAAAAAASAPAHAPAEPPRSTLIDEELETIDFGAFSRDIPDEELESGSSGEAGEASVDGAPLPDLPVFGVSSSTTAAVEATAAASTPLATGGLADATTSSSASPATPVTTPAVPGRTKGHPPGARRSKPARATPPVTVWEGIESWDVTALVSGHLDYPRKLRRLLKLIGLEHGSLALGPRPQPPKAANSSGSAGKAAPAAAPKKA